MTIDFPEKGFVDEYGVVRRRKPSATIVVKRDVVAPIIIRNSDQERADTEKINGTPRAESNPEKFTTVERLSGLDLLRKYEEQSDADLISDDYLHNERADYEEMLHIGSITYGNVGTGDEDYGVKSRVKTGYVYTTDPYDVGDGQTRNSAYETGTMINEEGKQSSALYEVTPVTPGNSFVQFITVEAATHEQFLYVLHNLLNSDTYGARTTRTGRNIRNEILGIVLADHPATLATHELLSRYHSDEVDIETAIKNYISDIKRVDWDVYGDTLNADEPEWYTEALDVAARQRDDSDDVLREEFQTFTDDIKSRLNE